MVSSYFLLISFSKGYPLVDSGPFLNNMSGILELTMKETGIWMMGLPNTTPQAATRLNPANANVTKNLNFVNDVFTEELV